MPNATVMNVGGSDYRISDQYLNECFEDVTEAFGINLFDLAKSENILYGYSQSASGENIVTADFCVVKNIPVIPGKNYIVTVDSNSLGRTIRFNAYNGSGFVSNIGEITSNAASFTFTANSSTSLLTVSLPMVLMAHLFVKQGSTASSFVPGFTSKDNVSRGVLDTAGFYVLNKSHWQQGSIDANGAEINSGESYNYRIRTIFIPVTFGTYIEFDITGSENAMQVVYYGDAKDFLYKSPWYTGTKKVRLRVLPRGYIRIVARIGYTAPTTVNDIDNFKAKVFDNVLAYVPRSYNFSGIDTYFNTGKMQFAAHRGARLYAPENSLPAFEIAGQQGYQWLNLAQLRQSASGTWYVMHDSSIDRTTNGTGEIKNLTDEYLRTVRIDVGPNIETFTEDQLVIPTLEQAIQIARKYGMKLYFRIASITSDDYYTDQAKWESFLSIIKKYDCSRMLFGGNEFGDIFPIVRDIALDYCINYDCATLEKANQQLSNYVNSGIKNAMIFVSNDIITTNIIGIAKAYGFKVGVFDPSSTGEGTITKARALELSNWGVDFLSGVAVYDLSDENA